MVNRIDIILTLSEYTRHQLIDWGIRKDKIYVTRPGVQGKWEAQDYKRLDFGFERLVLFWRDAEWQSGTDICAEAFGKLASEYPDIGFIFAIRHAHEYEDKLRDLARTHNNIQLYVFPYNDFDIADLVASASLVVLPFRKLSINPQIALLETLATATPVITTPVESNREVIISGETGILVAATVSEVYAAVKNALENLSYMQQIGVRAKDSIRLNWNWGRYEQELINLYETYCAK